MKKTKKFSRTLRPKYTPKRNPTAEIGVIDRNTGTTYTTAIKNKTRKLSHTPGFNYPKYIDPVRTIRNTIRNVKSPNSPFFHMALSYENQKTQIHSFEMYLVKAFNLPPKNAAVLKEKHLNESAK